LIRNITKYDIQFKPRAVKDIEKLSSRMQIKIIKDIERMGVDLAGDVKRLTNLHLNIVCEWEITGCCLKSKIKA